VAGPRVPRWPCRFQHQPWHVLASHRLVNPDNIPAVEIVAATPLPPMSDDPIPQTSAPTDHAAIVATFSL
jgi:hypothetical protein